MPYCNELCKLVRTSRSPVNFFRGTLKTCTGTLKTSPETRKVFQKIQDLLNSCADEEPPNTVKIEDARKAKVICDQTVQFAEWPASVLVASDQLGIKNKPLDNFWLAPGRREFLLYVLGFTKAIKKKLAKDGAPFTAAEVAGMTMALAEELPDADPKKQLAVHLVAQH